MHHPPELGSGWCHRDLFEGSEFCLLTEKVPTHLSAAKMNEPLEYPRTGRGTVRRGSSSCHNIIIIMWTLKSIFFVLVVKATVAMTFATAFSPLSTSPSKYNSASSRAVSPIALHYSRGYNDNVDVDVTDTPMFPLTTTTRSSVERRPSPVIALQSIEDYRKHVLCDIDGNDYYSYNRDRNHKNDTYDQLCIVRFSAPWCKACKATNVAWERMTTKLTSHTIASSTNNNNLGPPLLRFYEVVIGPAGSSSVALKDMLGVDHIPQGIIHHPSRGLFGRKVDLNRSNLSLLKKQLLESNSIDRLDTLLRGMD